MLTRWTADGRTQGNTEVQFSKVNQALKKDLGRCGHGRYVNLFSYGGPRRSGVVDRPQRLDDSGWLFRHLSTASGRNRSHSISWMAACLQWRSAFGIRLAHARRWRGSVGNTLVGILYIVIAAYVLINPVAGLASLTLALAVYLLFEAVLELVLSFRLRPLPGSGWLLLDGIVTLILAILIWRSWPSSSAWAIGTLVGISMLFSGIARLMLSVAARRLVSKLA